MTPDAALQQIGISTKAKRLRSLWPAIEGRLAEGVSHAEILAALNESGFGLTERTYKSCLYRHRKRRRTSSRATEAVPSTVTTSLQSPDMTMETPSHPPAELKRHQRPPTFDYDPRGLSPDLLK